MPVKVLIDHKGLEYFMTTKKFMPRQAKWTEFLSKFNFLVIYQTGKKNNKTDALTRKPNKCPVDNKNNKADILTKKPNKCPVNNKNNKQKHRMQTLLPPKRIEMHSIEVTDQLEERHKSKY